METNSLSAVNRFENLEEAARKNYDLIIIGGGITGAGIALDAAARGMEVLLLEKYDFAGGTSSKSTKLIHGGLRYLKQLEFGLVRTVGIERAVIHRLAPHLVEPINMVLPIYKNGSLGKFSTALALRVYDTLAKVEKDDRYYMIDAGMMQQFEPLISTEGLMGGAVYKEFRTDDARLTISALKSAAQLGATCFNYLKANTFIYTDNKISGVEAQDLISGNTFTFNSKTIINAAGPWVDEVRSLEQVPKGKKLHLTKGVHIVVSKNVLPVQHALYFDVPGDGRMIFVIPRGEVIYIGTTDTNYTETKDNIRITKEDALYLITAVNALFPKVALNETHILSGWAGLRPLIHEDGKSPSELSRKDEIFISEKGLISIAGGKLTGYRKMAEKVVNLVVKLPVYKGKTWQASKTKELLLFGADFEIPIDEYIERRTGEAKQIDVDFKTVHYLVHTYGTAAETIINMAFDIGNEIRDPATRIFTAELIYAIEQEMVTNISDFLIRRTGCLYFDIHRAREMYQTAADVITQKLSLDEVNRAQQIAFFENALVQVLPT
jgi:glycerol-3-phosphate dehydrogenase